MVVVSLQIAVVSSAAAVGFNFWRIALSLWIDSAAAAAAAEMTANPPTTTATATTAGTYRTVLLYTTGTERLNILTIYIHLYWPLFACSIWVIVSGTLSSFFIPAILLLLFHSQKFKYKTLCLKIIKKGQSTVSKKKCKRYKPFSSPQEQSNTNLSSSSSSWHWATCHFYNWRLLFMVHCCCYCYFFFLFRDVPGWLNGSTLSAAVYVAKTRTIAHPPTDGVIVAVTCSSGGRITKMNDWSRGGALLKMQHETVRWRRRRRRRRMWVMHNFFGRFIIWQRPNEWFGGW